MPAPSSAKTTANDGGKDEGRAARHAPADTLLLDLDSLVRHAEGLAAGLAPGDVIALWGDLGAGKTTFARALIRARAAACGRRIDEVPSPTFTLVQTYDLPTGDIWHFDLYRLAAPDEVFELGIEDALAGGIALIEWPARLGPLLPARRIDVELSFTDDPSMRAVAIRPHDGRHTDGHADAHADD